jgi:hypothetical protein
VCQAKQVASNNKTFTPEMRLDIPVKLADLAPDIVMSDLTEFKINFEDLKV